MSVNSDKTKFMYTENGGYTWEEYTAQAIGQSLLVCDGYGYEVRHNKETERWTLWISSGSRNSQRGLGHYYQSLGFDSLLECEFDAMAEIEEMVGLDLIEGGYWPHAGDRVMAVTMSDYNEFYKDQANG